MCGRRDSSAGPEQPASTLLLMLNLDFFMRYHIVCVHTVSISFAAQRRSPELTY